MLDSHDLDVVLKPGPPSHLVLRGNYGDRIHRKFRMSRQGVRWRFQRVMDMYVAAFETILTIERTFGADLRTDASRISRERYELRQQLAAEMFRPANAMRDEEAAGSGDTGG